MATKNYQWAAAVTVESGGYQGELISIEQNGVEVFSGSVNISQIPKTFNLPWTTTTNETGSSTYTYTYRDSDTMNNNNSTKVAITVTDEWAVSISKNNVMTVTVHTVMNSAVRTRIGSPSNVNRHIWMRRKSNGNDFNPFPLIDNASTAHTIASNVDMGTYVFSLQPGENAQNATVWWRSTSVGHEGDHIPNIYTDILRVGIHFKNILPKDYVPGKIWNDTSTTVETKTGTNITFDGTVHAPFEDLKVGGNIEQATIPSPSPDYPQSINVVTGAQTVTVSNGQGQTQNFTIGLGSVELCKIDDYQDYIYSVNGKWYVHKETSKVRIADGTFTLVNYCPQSTNSFPSDRKINTSAYYKYGRFNPVTTGITGTLLAGQFGWNTSNKMTFAKDDFSTIGEFNDFVANNNAQMYYILETPTDTQITNITFISQLNAIKSFGTYSGDTIIAVSGNIASPLTVSAKVFSDQGAWLSHNRTNGTAEIYNGLTWPQMRTYDGGVGTGNPPTIEHSDEVWRNQRLIGDE